MCSEFLTNKGELLELCMRTCVVRGNADINMTTKARCVNVVNWMELFFLSLNNPGWSISLSRSTRAELGAAFLHW